MIGSVVNVSGYLALGRAGLRGLPSDFAYTDVVPRSNSSRLFDGVGSMLQALDNSRNGIDQIKSALTKLRDVLQAARDQANIVPGRTELQPVVADIAQTVEKPTYITVNGELVQTGTINVSLGTRPLIVGYERANRTPLNVGEALKSLTSTAAMLVSTVGADGTGGFAADVSALLRSGDLTTAVNTPDTAAIDVVIGRIDDALAKAKGLQSQISARASAVAQVDLSGLLLSATPNSAADSIGLAGQTNDSSYRSNSNSFTGTQKSSWA